MEPGGPCLPVGFSDDDDEVLFVLFCFVFVAEVSPGLTFDIDCFAIQVYCFSKEKTKCLSKTKRKFE